MSGEKQVKILLVDGSRRGRRRIAVLQEAGNCLGQGVQIQFGGYEDAAYGGEGGIGPALTQRANWVEISHGRVR